MDIQNNKAINDKIDIFKSMLNRRLDDFVFCARQPYRGTEQERIDKQPLFDLIKGAVLSGIEIGKEMGKRYNKDE